MEDARADDGRLDSRHFRRRAAGPGRAQRRRHPPAAHFHDGSNLGHRDALVHLLGGALRRRDHLDSLQHPGRGLVGGDDLRRLSDGAARQGGGGAHGRFHVVLYRLAGGGAADHLPRAGHRLLRVEIRAAGIFRGLPSHLLLVRRPGARGEAQDHHFHDARPPACGRRHGHGLRPAAHDFRVGQSSARHQLPGRGHRPVRHQRNPADDGGAARAARPRRQDQPARSAEGMERAAAVLGCAATPPRSACA